MCRNETSRVGVSRERDAGRDACKSAPTVIVRAVTTELISEAWIWNCLVADVAVHRNTRVYDLRVLARCP